MKFGRLPEEDRPRIKFSDVSTGATPYHPESEDYLANLTNWDMRGNDKWGVCASVTWANDRRFITASLGDKEYYPTLDQVIELYKTQNPGFPDEDNGMNVQKLLEYLVKFGGPDGVKALGFARVNEKNIEELEAADATFGSLWMGIDVQKANMDQFNSNKPFDYVAGSPVEGGHAILEGGYGSPRPGPLAGYWDFITWAKETSFTELYRQKLLKEAWVVIWPEHLGSKRFIEGMDLAAFAAAYKALTDRDFPAVIPVPDPVPTVFQVYSTPTGYIKLKNKEDVKTINNGYFSVELTR